MPDEEIKPIYANVFQITPGPFDVTLDFGYKSPERQREQKTEYEILARISMSWSHAKAVLPILAKVIAGYEEQVGKIPSPGFKEKEKE